MGFFGTLLGTDQAKQAQQAADDTYNKQLGNIRALLGYGDEQVGKYNALASNYDPYTSTGLDFNNRLQTLLQNPESIRGQPGYQFNMDEGGRALENLNAARGTLNSGRASKDVMRFSQGLADQTYGSTLDRLMNGSKMGLGAESMQTGIQAQGLGNQFDAQKSAYQGGMQSAGTVGQGIIAGANAQSAGMQNLINIGGMILGAATGTGSLGGSKAGNSGNFGNLNLGSTTFGKGIY